MKLLHYQASLGRLPAKATPAFSRHVSAKAAMPNFGPPSNQVYGSAAAYYGTSDAIEGKSTTFEETRVRVMKEMKVFIVEDLNKLATNKENDWSKYAEDILFADPITRFESKSLYIANIQMLKALFRPQFWIHSVEITGYEQITSRWTMSLNLDMIPTWVLGARPPSFEITGTTLYRIDVVNQRVIEHVDTWDSVKNQQFFSVEGAADMIRGIITGTTQLTPNIPTPKYTVLVRTSDYEVREYEQFVAAEVPMRTSSNDLLNFLPSEVANLFSGPNSGAGFNNLAGYIFGGNAAKQKYEMTTPVFSRTDGTSGGVMAFPIDGVLDAAALPQPNDPSVAPKNVPKAIVAALRFSGFPLDNEVKAAVESLRTSLARDGLSFDGGYELARYNDPWSPPFLRRNEVIIRLENYKMPIGPL